MDPRREQELMLTRRQLFGRAASGIGVAALASLVNPEALAAPANNGYHGVLAKPHFEAKAKRVIYLFQSGAPSHIDLFDWKPEMKELTGKELPKSVRGDQRITGMTSGQAQLLVAGSPFKFDSHGKCGTEISELLPNTAKI